MELNSGFAMLLTAIALLACAVYCIRKKTGFLGALLRLLFIVYLGAVVNLTLFPLILFGRPGQTLPHAGLNLVPFLDMIKTVATYGGYHDWRATIPWTVLGGNVALFLPLGVFLPLVFPSLRRFRRVLLVIVLCSCGIELSQLAEGLAVGQLYRYVDINDVILNSAGGLIGFGAYAAARRLLGWGFAGRFSQGRNRR